MQAGAFAAHMEVGIAPAGLWAYIKLTLKYMFKFEYYPFCIQMNHVDVFLFAYTPMVDIIVPFNVRCFGHSPAARPPAVRLPARRPSAGAPWVQWPHDPHGAQWNN